MAAPRRRVRMREVAEHAGVSTSTVSHVLNGTRFVSPATQAAVLAAAEELGYELPETVEIAPSRRTLGIAISSYSNPYMAELIQGVEQEAIRAGFALFLCDSHDNPKQESEAVRTLLTHHVDAIVLAPTSQWEETALPLLHKGGRPYVLIDRLSASPCDQVVCDSASATATLIEHLIGHGHHRIGMVSGLPGLSTSQERLRGYQRALVDAGLAVDEHLVRCGHSSASGGRAAVHSLLRNEPRPTAIFSANNAMTVGALQAFDELGIRVGDDVALVGFDDFEWASAVRPALTTVAQPFHAMGARAVQLLLHRLENPMAAHRVVRLPTEIQYRDSCGCPPLDRRFPEAPRN
ncbi:LacI family DNA-binding transcriptional regulator [Flexivirga caeni]|nr:LacI family DNA-binding transcriptional regulator [Flexivirga caeni]